MRARGHSRNRRPGLAAHLNSNWLAMALCGAAFALAAMPVAAGEVQAELRVSITVVAGGNTGSGGPPVAAQATEREQRCLPLSANCLGANPGRVSLEGGAAAGPFDGGDPPQSALARTALTSDPSGDGFTILIEY